MKIFKGVICLVFISIFAVALTACGSGPTSIEIVQQGKFSDHQDKTVKEGLENYYGKFKTHSIEWSDVTDQDIAKEMLSSELQDHGFDKVVQTAITANNGERQDTLFWGVNSEKKGFVLYMYNDGHNKYVLKDQGIKDYLDAVFS